MYSRPAIALCLLILALTGPAQAQEEALEVLRTLDHAALWESFLRAPEHTRYSRTERKTDGSPTPMIEVAVARAAISDSSRSITESADSFDMPALISSLLPEDPPYLEDRYSEDFRYSTLPDTLLLGRSARVVHVAAHPERGLKQPLQEVRYFIDNDLGDIVALSVTLRTQTLFYLESSAYFIQLRQAQGLGWVPYLVRIATHLKLPLRPAVSLLRTEAFYSYAET